MAEMEAREVGGGERGAAHLVGVAEEDDTAEIRADRVRDLVASRRRSTHARTAETEREATGRGDGGGATRASMEKAVRDVETRKQARSKHKREASADEEGESVVRDTDSASRASTARRSVRRVDGEERGEDKDELRTE